MTTESSANANANPYSPPKSELDLEKTQGEVPSISEALSRGYDFSIGELLGEAGRLINGCKGSIIGASLTTFVVLLVVLFVLGLVADGLEVVLSGSQNAAAFVVVNMLVNMLSSMLIYPLLGGVLLIGIRRAGNYPVSFAMLFDCLPKAVPILLTTILMNIMLYVPTVLLVVLVAWLLGSSWALLTIPVLAIYVIYLTLGYSLALPLVFERGLSPWQALETSRKAIGQHWFKVFGLMLLLSILYILGSIPLLIGLIWVIPLMVVTFGVLYRTIFGVLPPSN